MLKKLKGISLVNLKVQTQVVMIVIVFLVAIAFDLFYLHKAQTHEQKVMAKLNENLQLVSQIKQKQFILSEIKSYIMGAYAGLIPRNGAAKKLEELRNEYHQNTNELLTELKSLKSKKAVSQVANLVKSNHLIDEVLGNTKSILTRDGIDKDDLVDELEEILEDQWIDLVSGIIGPIKYLGKEVAKVANDDYLAAQKETKATAMISWIVAITITLFGIIFVVFIVTNITKKLKSAIQTFQNNLGVLADNVLEMEQSNNRLKAASQEQASGVQETVSSLEEISATIESNSRHADNVEGLSKKSQQFVRSGKEISTEVLHSIKNVMVGNKQTVEVLAKQTEDIQRILEYIKEISGKTEVINDIVFQTKMLSFNASVEAARAGEHGKGFAIVAEEIANLANSSGHAAEEIATILNQSVKDVDTIVQESQASFGKISELNSKNITEAESKATESLKIFDNIVSTVDNAYESSAQVKLSSKEQASGVAGIFEAMKLIDSETINLNKLTVNNSKLNTDLVEIKDDIMQATENLNQLIEKNNNV